MQIKKPLSASAKWPMTSRGRSALAGPAAALRTTVLPRSAAAHRPRAPSAGCTARPPPAPRPLHSPPPHRDRDRHRHRRGWGCRRRLPAAPAPGAAPPPLAWCSPCCRRAAPAPSSLHSFLSCRPPFRAPRRRRGSGAAAPALPLPLCPAARCVPGRGGMAGCTLLEKPKMCWCKILH